MRSSTVTIRTNLTYYPPDLAFRWTSGALLTFLLVIVLLLQLIKGGPDQLRSVVIQLHGRPLPQLRHLRLVPRADVYPSGRSGVVSSVYNPSLEERSCMAASLVG